MEALEWHAINTVLNLTELLIKKGGAVVPRMALRETLVSAELMRPSFMVQMSLIVK